MIQLHQKLGSRSTRILGNLSSQLKIGFSTDCLENLLQKVAEGHISPKQVLSQLQLEYSSVSDFAKIDGQRSLRTGFPEAVYAEGKSIDQLEGILSRMVELDTNDTSSPIIATRVSVEAKTQLEKRLKGFTYYPTARILSSRNLKEWKSIKTDTQLDGKVAVLAAGTSDLPICEEAAISLELTGISVDRFYDVGVAGIHRLLRNRQEISKADVIICVAGMDGALPGVVGGLFSSPVIAVPTSIGYGASFSGVAPLLSMLNSCSPGVGVVNIDNGFGGAVLAVKILKLAIQGEDKI